ncbi:MAG: helix-hairpin-helix domain-containing protein [Phocaeicola sp.]
MSRMNHLLRVMLIFCLIAIYGVHNLSAQEELERYAEELLTRDDGMNEAALDNYLEELTDQLNQPLLINTITKEQLESFPFLTPQLVENILYYLYKYGPMLTEKELAMVEGMDQETIRYLLPYLSFEQPPQLLRTLKLNQALKYGKQQLLTRVDFPFQTKVGYQPYSQEEWAANPNKRYLGYANYHNVRYRFQYSNQLYAGITMEKDAGEPFFSGLNKKGYDYYSLYLLIRNVGKINSLALGNYRLNYGYGLVINNDFSLGKSASLTAMEQRSTQIKRHSSTDEYNYLRGAAMSYRLTQRWSVDAFYSHRTHDGMVDNGVITSIKSDGYHRIVRDFERKNRFTNQLFGSHLGYNGKQMEVGITAVYNVFNRLLSPVDRGYNRYTPRGNWFANVGINYKGFWKRFTLLGETAVDKAGSIATLNRLSYSPNSETQWVVMNRFYDTRYYALTAQAVGEGSSVQNESGFYMGLQTRLLRLFKLSCYLDYFYFPWQKYLISKPGTDGIEAMGQLSYSPRYKLDMFIRYRYKNREKDVTGPDKIKYTLPQETHRIRYQLSYSPYVNWVLKTTMDGVFIQKPFATSSTGYAIGQSVRYKFTTFPLQLDGSGVWFSTSDYDSRITLYEKSVLYAYSMPSFFYQGFRGALNARCEFYKQWLVELKYGCTYYSNREQISSGLELIEGNVKSDLIVQLSYKF